MVRNLGYKGECCSAGIENATDASVVTESVCLASFPMGACQALVPCLNIRHRNYRTVAKEMTSNFSTQP